MVATMSAASRQRPGAAAFREDPTDQRHGTMNGYVNLGCRCSDCRAANVARLLRVRLERAERLAADDPRHGLASTYYNHSCRCDPCRSAATEASRRVPSTRLRRLEQAMRAVSS